jgi:hypothetical protein
MAARELSEQPGYKHVTTPNRRDRTVIFRVTEREYACLKSACDAAGARSISEYTRSELLFDKHGGSSDAFFLQWFLDLDRRINEIYQLTNQILESMRADCSSKSG